MLIAWLVVEIIQHLLFPLCRLTVTLHQGQAHRNEHELKTFHKLRSKWHAYIGSCQGLNLVKVYTQISLFVFWLHLGFLSTLQLGRHVMNDVITPQQLSILALNVYGN